MLQDPSVHAAVRAHRVAVRRLEGLKDGFTDGFSAVEYMCAEYDRRRRFMVDFFNGCGLPCFEPRGAFYAYPSVEGTGMTGEQFANELLREEKVAVVPGARSGRRAASMCAARMPRAWPASTRRPCASPDLSENARAARYSLTSFRVSCIIECRLKWFRRDAGSLFYKKSVPPARGGQKSSEVKEKMAEEFIMTQKGYDEAVERLKYLQTEKKKEITERIKVARGLRRPLRERRVRRGEKRGSAQRERDPRAGKQDQKREDHGREHR